MSFLRHQEIFPSDGGANLTANTPAHRLDEFPAGYSLAGCSPAWPASASPTGTEYAVQSVCWSRNFHRTGKCVLTVCVSRGDKRKLLLSDSKTETQLELLGLILGFVQAPEGFRTVAYKLLLDQHYKRIWTCPHF